MSPFERLKASCLKKKELFTDPDFPADPSSVFYHQIPPVHFVWKRPKDLCQSPVFVDDAPEKLKLTAGKLGDHSFASCVGLLASLRGLFFRVVPADQGFSQEQGYAGLYRFRLWWCGEWREVAVDDRLPTAPPDDRLLFAHSPDGGAFWPALLEKAYAKLHGSYEALRYGSAVECLSDLTGGITEALPLGPTAPSILKTLLSMTTIVTAVAHRKAKTATETLPNGIQTGLNYRLLKIQKVHTKESDEVTVVWLKIPQHMESRYNEHCDDILFEMDLPLEEDQFCMPLEEFMATFSSLEVVHLDGATSSAELSLAVDRAPWHQKLFVGHWQKGVNAGGCRNHHDTFHVNPQLQLVVGESQDVVICLSQHVVLDPRVIGFSLYQMSKPTSDVLGKSFFKVNKSILNSAYSNSRQVSARCHLNQGCYVLLPTTFEPHQEAKYTLRLLSAKLDVRMTLLDLAPSLMKPAIILAPKPEQHVGVSSYEAVFLRLADEHKTLSAFELLELLETCLPNDYVKSCATLEVCRQIILALDKGRSGRLRYQDYKNLMCSLKLWQTIFRSHSRGSSGILRAEKLRGALMDVGFQVNTDVLSLLVIRYMRKDGTLRFGDFVLCILHLMVAFGTFEKKDLMQNGFVKTTLSEWLQASLQC